MSNDFCLNSEELALVLKKKLQTQLAFALMLKFFQLKNKYPDSTKNVPLEMIGTLSSQLEISQESIKKFDWIGRTAERFRQEIRRFLGFRKPTVIDSANLIKWLMQHHLPSAPLMSHCMEYATQYLRKQKIESFADNKLTRYVRSAQAQFEKDFFQTVILQLQQSTLKSLDELLLNDSSFEEHDNSNAIKLFHLKKDIGEARLKNIESVIEKINFLKTLALPNVILKKYHRKLLLKYYRRIMAEHPSHIQEHDFLRKSAMMVIFCFVRSQMLIADR